MGVSPSRSASTGDVLLARVVAGIPGGESPLIHVAKLPSRTADVLDWPDWADHDVVAALRRVGVVAPWSHQVAAASLAHAGQHVLIATGTASGKSLAYQLPVLTAMRTDRRATALYLAPTKALAADQLRAVVGCGLDGVRAAGFDGDTPRDERDWVRNHARWVFTNPDMLHRGILPRHGRWALFLRRLRYVVLDECHIYRGLFGSHVALLIRRLRRISARYGTNPTFVLASATVAEPARPATALTGLPVVAVTEDESPRGEQTVALWEPPLQAELAGEHGAPVRRSAGAEAARIMADLVLEGARTLTFVRSRRGAELTALATRRMLSQVDPALADRVAAYRAGFLPEERRALESALSCGELLGVATTNALGLGVDIAGLDAVVVAGYPGTRASFWQQAGRAGRKSRDALVVLVAGDDPLDSYLVHHPEALLGAPVEQCVLDPANPYVLAPQLACAAVELPITPADLDGLFGPAAVGVLESLVAQGQLRRRAAGWFRASPSGRPSSDVDIRGSGGGQVTVVEGDSGRMLGTVDLGTAPGTVHPGAVYLHQGSSFVVDELDLDAGLALVHAEDPEWNTSARAVVDIVISSTLRRRGYGPVDVALGEVEVTEKVVGYLRRLPSGEVLDQVPLDMPVRTLRTRAVWYTVTDGLLAAAGLDPARIPGSLHAAGHAAIGLLPLFATCDRWDIGGVSAALHRDTGRATVFVHDGHQGGAGFADRGYAALEPWLAATRDAIAGCGCPGGCPSCVQSANCGNGNEPLDKSGAVALLTAVVATLSADEGA